MPTYGLYLSTLVHEFSGIYVRKLSILFLYTNHIDLNLKAMDYAKTCLITSKSNRKINYILGLMYSNPLKTNF